MDTRKKAAFIINVIFYGTAAIIVFLAVKYALMYTLPFIISFAAVYSLQKPMIALSRRLGINKNLLTLIFIIVLLAVFFTLAVTLLYRLGCAVVCGIREQMIDFSALGDKYLQGISRLFGVGTDTIVKVFNNAFSSLCGSAVSAANAFLRALPKYFVTSIVSVASACFFCFSYDDFAAFVKRNVGNKTVDNIRKLKRVVNDSVLKIIKGYMLLACVTFAFMALGLGVLGVKGFFGIAALVAVVDLLPVLGTGIILLPWAAIALFSGDSLLGIGLIALYILFSVARYFLEPRIVGAKVGLNPLVSLAAMFLGLKLFGVIGLVLLPLTAAVLTVLYKNGIIKGLK